MIKSLDIIWIIMKGYIYIRTNEWYELKEVYKIGITTSIKDRNILLARL